MFASYLVVYNWLRLENTAAFSSFMVRFAITNLLLIGAILYLETWIRSIIFALLLAVAAASGWYLHTSVTPSQGRTMTARSAFTACALLGVAFLVWNLDKHGVFCDMHSLYQGHAAWHVLAAIAAGYVFIYLRSERPTDRCEP